jgi:hypothetical protein
MKEDVKHGEKILYHECYLEFENTYLWHRYCAACLRRDVLVVIVDKQNNIVDKEIWSKQHNRDVIEN